MGVSSIGGQHHHQKRESDLDAEIRRINNAGIRRELLKNLTGQPFVGPGHPRPISDYGGQTILNWIKEKSLLLSGE